MATNVVEKIMTGGQAINRDSYHLSVLHKEDAPGKSFQRMA